MTLEWVGLAAVGGIIATCWSQVKAIFGQIRSTAIVSVAVDREAAYSIQAYLYRHFKKFGLGSPQYTGNTFYIDSRDRVELAIGEKPSAGGAIMYRGWCIIWAQMTEKKSMHGGHDEQLTISYIRGTLDHEEMFIEASRELESTVTRADDGTRRCRIEHFFGRFGKAWANRDDGHSSAPSIAENDGRWQASIRWITHTYAEITEKLSGGDEYIRAYAFDDQTAEAHEEFDRWVNSKKWYRDRGVPWRRGYLLTGDPGTGKTSLVRILAAEHRLPIYVLHLETMDNEELHTNWKRVLESAPCIVLIEDIDAVFDGRKTISGGITFDALLNCIDGIQQTSGVALFITTNHPEKLDPALAADDGDESRPGRIDRIVRFGPLTENGRRQIAGRILQGYPNLIESAVESCDGCSGAQFQERCIRLALEAYWNSELPLPSEITV